MPRKKLLALAVSASLASLGGCATCRPDAGNVALCPAETADDCVPNRGRAVAFLLGGADILDAADLSGLRDKLAEAGFASVYVGQFYHRSFFAVEMDRLRCDDPHVRFVVVGCEAGTPAALSLAAHGRKSSYPVDAVFALDPVGPLDGQTAVLKSKYWTGGTAGAVGETTLSVSHFGLPTEPHVVASVANAMRDSAGRVVTAYSSPPILPLIDDPAPIPNVLPDPPKSELIRTPGTLTGRPR